MHLDIRLPIISKYNIIFAYWNNYQTSRLMIIFAYPLEFIAYANYTVTKLLKKQNVLCLIKISIAYWIAK